MGKGKQHNDYDQKTCEQDTSPTTTKIVLKEKKTGIKGFFKKAKNVFSGILKNKNKNEEQVNRRSELKHSCGTKSGDDVSVLVVGVEKMDLGRRHPAIQSQSPDRIMAPVVTPVLQKKGKVEQTTKFEVRDDESSMIYLPMSVEVSNEPERMDTEDSKTLSEAASVELMDTGVIKAETYPNDESMDTIENDIEAETIPNDESMDTNENDIKPETIPNDESMETNENDIKPAMTQIIRQQWGDIESMDIKENDIEAAVTQIMRQWSDIEFMDTNEKTIHSKTSDIINFTGFSPATRRRIKQCAFVNTQNPVPTKTDQEHLITMERSSSENSMDVDSIPSKTPKNSAIKSCWKYAKSLVTGQTKPKQISALNVELQRAQPDPPTRTAITTTTTTTTTTTSSTTTPPNTTTSSIQTKNKKRKRDTAPTTHARDDETDNNKKVRKKAVCRQKPDRPEIQNADNKDGKQTTQSPLMKKISHSSLPECLLLCTSCFIINNLDAQDDEQRTNGYDRVRKNYSFLQRNIDGRKVMGHMFSQLVFDKDDLEEIQSFKNRNETNIALLDKLLRKLDTESETFYPAFINALRYAKHYKAVRKLFTTEC